MKNIISLLFFLKVSIILAQSPGGVSGSEMWCKVNKVNPAGSTFQYKDYSTNNKSVTTGVGTVLSNGLFNYNFSLSFDNSDYVSYLSKVESLKDATIFIVNLPTTPTDPATKYALISADLDPAITLPAGSINEGSFRFGTTNFEKESISIIYPGASSVRPNGRINTLLWHDFNSKKIINSFGSTGESNIFIGKPFTGNVNFVGQIPEFIVYRRALNDKEKWRVESYLALKYGITLQPEVNYYTSKNEIFWHKENNAIFKNQIFGLGRDSNSTLYQKQSTSIHDPQVLKSLIFWTGTLKTDNNLNTGYIEDQSFLAIGDNNASEIPNAVLNNGIKKLDKTWLVEKFGPSTHNLTTSLKYKPDPSVVLLPNEAFWLVVANNATHTSVANFNAANVSYYPIEIFDSDGYSIYTNLKLASYTTIYSQFTFGVGPRMLVIPTVVPMVCEATQGNVNISIKGGQPIFTINVHGTDNVYNLQLNQPGFDLALSLNTGNYQVTVTDALGYTQSAYFEISPTPGISIELGADQYLITGDTLLLDASLAVTSSSATYQWFKDGSLIGTTAVLPITQQGNYQCIITDSNSGCSVEDTIKIVTVETSNVQNYSGVYPNPTSIGENFHVFIHLEQKESISITIYDVTGKKLFVKTNDGDKDYDEIFQLNVSGIYFVKVEAAGYSTTHKVVIN